MVVLISSFAIIIALTVLASAVNGQCASNQVIMRLSGATNAHGALWNEEGTRICYSDIFQPEYNGTNPHDCDSNLNDLVLTLSNVSNAHASSNSYSVNVCYRGLSECTIESSGCPSGKTPILYVSGTNNAHLAKWTTAGYSTYSTVCCKGEGTAVSPSLGPLACYELDEESCNQDDEYGGIIAQSDPGCPIGESCRCFWNATAGQCRLEWGSVTLDNGCSYRCVVQSSEQTACSGGSKILSLIATAVLTEAPQGVTCASSISPEESGCRSSSATVPCGELEANLPFFGFWQLLTSAILIAAAHILINRKTEHS